MPKIPRFFPFPATVLLLLCLCWCLIVEFWWFEAPEPSNVHVRSSQTPPKFHEKTPRETQKERNGGGRRKNKYEILGGPAESKPTTTPTLTPQKWRVEAGISVPEGWGAKGLRRVGAPLPGCWGSGLNVQTPSGTGWHTQGREG